MHNKNKILLVEDEAELAASVSKYLDESGYVCTHVDSLKSAREILKNKSFNTILLDLGLPDGDGLSLIKEVKEKDYTTGVIIISAKDALFNKVNGLDLGADDYLTKPFFMPELNARINSLIRRLNFEGNNEIVIGSLKVIPEQMQLLVNDKNVDLTNTEFNLLLYFITNKNRVLSKTNLADYMSSNYHDYSFSDDLVYTHIKNLKKKLEKAESEDYIKNVYGVGYKFIDS
jgi:DNA-binding response OmpR family regulator